MSKLYADLRGKMAAEDMPTAKLAHRVGVTPQHINNILSGRTQPRLDLCYEILEELGESPDKLPVYFPPKGIRIENPANRKTVPRIVRVGARAS